MKSEKCQLLAFPASFAARVFLCDLGSTNERHHAGLTQEREMQRSWDFKDSMLAKGGDSFVSFPGHMLQWGWQCKQWCSCQCWKAVMSLQEQFCDLGTWSWFVMSKPSGESVTCPISLNKIPFLLKLPVMYFYCLWPKRSNTLLLYLIPMVLEWLCQISSWDVDTSYQSHLQVCQSNNPVRKEMKTVWHTLFLVTLCWLFIITASLSKSSETTF